MAQDYASPRAALKMLEDAYTARDLDAAIAAKDFRFEAEDMLSALARQNGWEEKPDGAMIAKTEEVLRLNFAKHLIEQGFPDFSDYDCRIVSESDVRENLVQLVEECVSKSDGAVSQQALHAFKGADGWRIVVVAGRH